MSQIFNIFEKNKTMVTTSKQSSFKVGEIVLISPEVTHEKD